MTITNYKCLISNNIESLERDVKRYIDLGWQPFGGISYQLLENHKTNYAQAMVRYDN